MTSHRYIASGGRWTARRKLDLIKTLQAGQITREMLCAQYDVSDDELAEWLQRYGNGEGGARARLRASDMSVRWGGMSRKQRRMAAARNMVVPRDAAD